MATEEITEATAARCLALSERNRSYAAARRWAIVPAAPGMRVGVPRAPQHAVQPGRERFDHDGGDRVGDRGEHRDGGVGQKAGVVAKRAGPGREVIGVHVAHRTAALVVVALVEVARYGRRQRARRGVAAGDGLAADEAGAVGDADQDLV